MSMLLSSAVIFSSLFMMVYLHVRSNRFSEEAADPVRKVPWIFLCESILVSCDLAAGGDVEMRLPLDISLCIMSLISITSSVWDRKTAVILSKVISSMQILLAVRLVLSCIGIMKPLQSLRVVEVSVAVSVMTSLMYVASLWGRIRDVRSVIRAGTVWTGLTLAVDSIYVVSFMSNSALFTLLLFCFPYARWISYPIVIIMELEVIAIGIRIICGSVFVFMQRHERRIVESMKVSQMEVSSEGTKDDEHYKEIYDRVVAYFDEERPYLNGELTINDIVKVVFTNKLYISRAISQYTGRNFCQFVNYYRVTHSVNMFRQNPEMKIVDLASACGFNSVVSFNMAFRLFMGENPGDWCRKERMQLLKRKNKLWNR